MADALTNKCAQPHRKKTISKFGDTIYVKKFAKYSMSE